MKVADLYVYLSGPVSGIDRKEAVAGFSRAENRCRKARACRVFNPTTQIDRGDTHEQAMLECLAELTQVDDISEEAHKYVPAPLYDVLVQLPGWETSPGCIVEATVAKACGIPCVELSEVE